jgi:very-short-patch-repair endonuclease
MSALERRLREVLRLAGFHDARFEAAPPWWPEGPERVDVLLEVERVIVEGDGRAWHQRVADFENDRRRDNLAALHGYRVVRLTWTMVTRLRAATVRDLRRLRVPAA